MPTPLGRLEPQEAAGRRADEAPSDRVQRPVAGPGGWQQGEPGVVSGSFRPVPGGFIATATISSSSFFSSPGAPATTASLVGLLPTAVSIRQMDALPGQV